MAWQRIVGSALVALGVAGAGCESSPKTLARNQFLEDPDLISAIARNGGGQGTDSIRGQMPETRPPSNLLDIPPARPADAPATPSSGIIRAVVNDQAILDEEVRAIAYSELLRASFLREPERSKRTTEVYNAALNSLIEREIVLQDAFKMLKDRGKAGDHMINKLREAAREGFEKEIMKPLKNQLKTDAEIKRYFAEFGTSLTSVRRAWERHFMEFEYLRTMIFPLLETRVNHPMIVEYYETHPEEFLVADSVKWQDLFVAAGKHGSREEARALAESLVDQARKGADFVKLVKDNDDGDSTLRDGDGVGGKRGEIKPVEAEPILFNLTDGQVGDVIELSTGFHVVKLVHRQKAGQLPFDETVQKRIRDKLRNEFFEREMKRIIRELKQKAVVVIAQNQQTR